MNIYDVKVCKFISVSIDKNIFRLNRNEFVTHYCVVDFNRFLATDVFTNEQFRVLAKNENGQILASEKVELNQNYAIYINSLDLNKLSRMELWKLKLAYFKFTLLRKKPTIDSKKPKQNITKRW